MADIRKQKRKVVLFIEDDPEDVQLTLMAMEDILKPYDVVVAKDGVEALDFLFGTGAYAGRDTNEKPRLIILDINLPRINGIEVLERLNQEWGAGLAGIKVAVLSSSYVPEERARIRTLGAALHLQKPLRPNDAVAMTREIGILLLGQA